MLEGLAEKLLQYIIGGGPGAMISIFFGLCLVMGWWIMRLEKKIQKKDDRLDEVIDSNQKANMALADSITLLTRSIIESMKTRI